MARQMTEEFAQALVKFALAAEQMLTHFPDEVDGYPECLPSFDEAEHQIGNWAFEALGRRPMGELEADLAAGRPLLPMPPVARARSGNESE